MDLVTTPSKTLKRFVTFEPVPTIVLIAHSEQSLACAAAPLENALLRLSGTDKI